MVHDVPVIPKERHIIMDNEPIQRLALLADLPFPAIELPFEAEHATSLPIYLAEVLLVDYFEAIICFRQA